MPQERDILKMIWTNFVRSLKPRQIKGNLVGKDHFGNKYLEIPPDPSIGKRRAERWFEPAKKDDFEQEMPSEWEAWLRGRRKEPPTDDEVLKNKAIAEMKKENAAELEAKIRPPGTQPKRDNVGEFPQYPEYEKPGKPFGDDRDK